MLKIQNSITTIVCDNNLCLSAFPTMLVFGKINNYEYDKNTSFRFFKTDFIDLYTSIVKIVTEVAVKSTKNGMILQRKAENLVYFWSVKQIEDCTIISMGIESSSEITTKVHFSLEEFNDFVLILSQLFLPTICFDFTMVQFLNKACSAPLNEILELRTVENCDKFVSKYKLSFETIPYLICYKEILVVICKLKSLYNPNLKQKILDDILQLTNPL